MSNVNIEKPLVLPCGAEIKNRICKAAMTEGLADEQNRATEKHVTLYSRWAEGGSGILLTGADKWVQKSESFAARLAPNRGREFNQLTSSTIRNVALGIVGVSILQATLLTIGFLAIGLPAAGLVSLIALVLCIVQIGPGLVSIGAIAWAFMNIDPVMATLFTAWTIPATICDSDSTPNLDAE